MHHRVYSQHETFFPSEPQPRGRPHGEDLVGPGGHRARCCGRTARSPTETPPKASTKTGYRVEARPKSACGGALLLQVVQLGITLLMTAKVLGLAPPQRQWQSPRGPSPSAGAGIPMSSLCWRSRSASPSLARRWDHTSMMVCHRCYALKEIIQNTLQREVGKAVRSYMYCSKSYCMR